jgi:hypothetical protein
MTNILINIIAASMVLIRWAFIAALSGAGLIGFSFIVGTLVFAAIELINKL